MRVEGFELRVEYREKWVKVLVRMGLNCHEVRNLGIGMALRLGT